MLILRYPYTLSVFTDFAGNSSGLRKFIFYVEIFKKKNCLSNSMATKRLQESFMCMAAEKQIIFTLDSNINKIGEEHKLFYKLLS